MLIIWEIDRILPVMRIIASQGISLPFTARESSLFLPTAAMEPHISFPYRLAYLYVPRAQLDLTALPQV